MAHACAQQQRDVIAQRKTLRRPERCVDLGHIIDLAIGAGYFGLVIARIGDDGQFAGQRRAAFELYASGIKLADLDLVEGVWGAVIRNGAIAFPDVVPGYRDQHGIGRVEFDARLELAPCLGNEGATVAGCTCDGLEAFGITEEGRNALDHFADYTCPERRCRIGPCRAAHASGAGPVTPRAKYDRHPVGKADLVLKVNAHLILIDIFGDIGRAGQAATKVGQGAVIDIVDIEHFGGEAAGLVNRIGAVIDARQYRVLDARSRSKIELHVIVGGEDFHPGEGSVRIQSHRALFGIGHEAAFVVEYRLACCRVEQDEGVCRIGIAIGIMREIRQVAVDIPGFEIDPDTIAEAMLEQRGPLQQSAVVPVPSWFADKQVVGKLPVGIGQDRADQRQELRRRTAVVFLVKADQGEFGVGCRLEGDGRREQDPVIRHVIGLRIGIADPRDDPGCNRIAHGAGYIDQRFLAVERTVAQRNLSPGFEFRTLGHEIDDPAQRALTEQDRRRAAHQFDLVEIIGVGADAGVIAEDVPHPVAELQRVDPAHQSAIDTAVGAIRVGRHTGNIVQRVADTYCALRQIQLVIDNRYRLRRFDDRRVRLRGGRALIARTGHDDGALFALVGNVGQRRDRDKRRCAEHGGLQHSHCKPSRSNMRARYCELIARVKANENHSQISHSPVGAWAYSVQCPYRRGQWAIIR